ncbi:MAG: S8 family serine peptidase, partial [Acidimicrobiales bacterium]
MQVLRFGRWSAAAAVALTAGLVPPAPGEGAPAPNEVPPCGPPLGFGPAHLFTTVDPGAEDLARGVLRRAGLDRVRARGPGVLGFVGDRAAAQGALAGAGLDAVVSPDCLGRRQEVPNDPGYSSQWALPAVRAPAAWDRTHGSASVVVAVVDSGVDGTHPDLAGQLVPGFDAVHNAALPAGATDPSGHGTAVAGVVAARTGNGGGLAALGWDTRVMMIKDGDVQPVRSATVAGIRRAADSGARIINVSSGYPTPDANEAAAVAYARGRGSLVVAAAGDAALSGNPTMYPAALEGVLAVGATGTDGARARYSSAGEWVDLVAPGGSGDGEPARDMHVLAPAGGTTFRSGTSFSAPLAAAAAALLLG